MSVIPLFTDEEYQRIEWFRSSPPGVQRMIIEVVELVVKGGETEKVRKEDRKILRVLRGKRP